MRQATVDALAALGRDARSAEAALESLADHDPEDRVRTAARQALKKLAADQPATAELARLRKQIEELRTRNTKLEGRLQKLETK